MKVIIVVFAKPEVGLGHWYRSLTLADELAQKGHFVWVCGNKMFLDNRHMYYQIRENDPDDLLHVLDQVQPDYLILDLQNKVPEYVYDLCDRYSVKTLVLNGVGRDEEDKADIIIIQGIADSSKKFDDRFYWGTEFIILRPELFNFPSTSSFPWFVWGGARDKMNLLNRFQLVFPKETSIMVSNEFSKYPVDTKKSHTVYNSVEGDAIFALMGSCEKACVAMGMIVWELVALHIPTYVFSWSEGHLGFAKRMEQFDLIRAYPEVGIPSNGEIAKFLSEPFVPDFTSAPDEKGASRIVKVMEDKLNER